MIRIALTLLITCLVLETSAITIIVKNTDELHAANKKAQPGDVIILQNGEWDNTAIILTCNGTKDKPITIKAQSPGNVMVTGESYLRIGGNFIIVEGLHFAKGYAGDEAVISFRSSKEQVANDCRVTNCVINDFNNPKRMDENNWVTFFGKRNRLDHCSFMNKKNMGVLLAVSLDDDRSRENFHSIDHNYFGKRPALGSNGGEIIRVGVSQHATFNSNTIIKSNFFEHCDGETEIISIKSGANRVEENVFKECQGSVVLRHGDNNLVENNVFFGNNKAATGGVRIINKGQWVINNFFYRCRGVDFRSPMAIMNGIPNSPAHRYVQVTDAVIANNTFVECSAISFGEGSDAERTLPPEQVWFINNIFYSKNDSVIYRTFDKISGIRFSGNEVSSAVSQSLEPGFTKKILLVQKNDNKPFPVSTTDVKRILTDSLQQVAVKRLGHPLTTTPGFSNLVRLKQIQAKAGPLTGASWFLKNSITKTTPPMTIRCANARQVYEALEKKQKTTILLTGNDYIFHTSLPVNSDITLSSTTSSFINIHTVPGMLRLFVIGGNASLSLQNLKLDAEDMKATHFIASDSIGASGHYNLVIKNCQFRYFNRNYGCENFFYAAKSTFADSIQVTCCTFDVSKTDLFTLAAEKNDRGYYPTEKLTISNNTFNNNAGAILDLYRGGNDESTLGPELIFTDNIISDCSTDNSNPLIRLHGVQRSQLLFNSFTNCNPQKTLISYTDIVRAVHLLEKNSFSNSGKVQTNNFVTQQKNNIQ